MPSQDNRQMEERVDHGTPDSQPAAAGERVGSDTVNSPVSQIGTNLANLDVAAADSVRADGSLLGLGRLLELQLDIGANTRESAELSEPAFPSFHDDDLPAPLFHDDDLPAPSFHDDDLPAPLLHEHDLPADLTTVGLSQLLGLEMSSGALPTVGEIVRNAFRRSETRETEPEDDEKVEDDSTENDDSDSDSDDPNAEIEGSDTQVAEAGDLSFIDPQSLTEKAETNDTDFAGGGTAAAELFGVGLPFSEGESEFDDEFDSSRDHPISTLTSKLSMTPANSGESGSDGESGSGGGVNVINGTAGDDALNGDAGTDILHGFAGNDTLDGGAGSDRLDGGLGDDVLVWDSADVKIDGKNGTDTLRVDGVDIDFTTFAGKLSGIEIVELHSDGGTNTITLSAQDVLDATDKDNTLTITGDDYSLNSSDVWSYGGTDVDGNHVYTQEVGSKTATLVVEPDISVNLNLLV
jgi:hypothetical protein